MKEKCFLTVVDHGPIRFAVWRSISGKSENAVKNALESIFCEHGALAIILDDNAPTFHGSKLI